MSYIINKDFALGANEGSSQVANRLYIILHDVGAESGARANAAYFKNNIAAEVAYTAFVVGDGGKVYQVGEPGYVQWGAGTVANANSPIQIELGHTSDPETFKKDYAVYVELARDMATKYGIPTSLDAGGVGTPGIKSHLWVTQHIWGDHTDPYGYLARWGVTKEKLAADLKNGTGSAPASTPAPKQALAKPAATKGAVFTNVTYDLHQLNGTWLGEVTNFSSDPVNGFAGNPNHAHDALVVKVNHGSVKYRVHTYQDGWLPYVTGYDRRNTANGFAGIMGHAIDGVQVYYTTPSGETYQQAYYRSQTTKRAGWLPAVRDDTDFAGMLGEPLDRLQIKIGTANPF
jgi:N-acetylmuramoyl-L-alanine amidase CwlA